MLSDSKLLLLFNENSDRALDILFKEYIGLVFTIVNNKLKYICSSDDIDECVNDVFFEFYQSLRNVNLEKGSIKAYLAVIAKRRSIDIYRKYTAINDKLISIDDENYIEPIFNQNIIEENLINDEINKTLISEIKSLGKPDSEIIIRKYFFEQSTKEISKALGIKINTIDKKISRCLSKLKIKLGGRI